MSDRALRFYSAAPVWLQNAAITGYGLVLKRRRYGPGYRRILRELEESQWASAEELKRLQLRLLNETLEAARSTPLYRRRGIPDGPLGACDELRDVPVLAKHDLRRPASELISKRAPSRPLEIHTGGTTGTPLTIYTDPVTIRRNYAFFERFKRWAGIHSGARVATFAGRPLVPPSATKPPYWRINYVAKTQLFSSYHISPTTIPQYVAQLQQFQPEMIDSYPSSLLPIARYLIEHEISSIRPRAVITSSETLDAWTRQVIEQAFGCRVFDHYGAAEMVALVTQCDHGRYHANPEFGLLEILRDGEPVSAGQPGEIVATGFINRTMPLVRYQTGDEAVWGDGDCPCGRAFPVVERIEGRRDDTLVTPEGRRIGRLDPIFKSVTGLYETRIVQDSPTHVRVEGVTTGEFSDAHLEALLAELALRLGPSMEIDFVPMDEIPRTASGKFRAVINEVPSGD